MGVTCNGILVSFVNGAAATLGVLVVVPFAIYLMLWTYGRLTGKPLFRKRFENTPGA